MNQPEDARVDWRGWWPAAIFRYVFTLWIRKVKEEVVTVPGLGWGSGTPRLQPPP